jgi:hypothetical protein
MTRPERWVKTFDRLTTNFKAGKTWTIMPEWHLESSKGEMESLEGGAGGTDL